MCLIDHTDGTPTLRASATAPAGGMCAGVPCWKLKATGASFKDKSVAHGLYTLGLKAGTPGKLKLKGKGATLLLPPLGPARRATATDTGGWLPRAASAVRVSALGWYARAGPWPTEDTRKTSSPTKRARAQRSAASGAARSSSRGSGALSGEPVMAARHAPSVRPHSHRSRIGADATSRATSIRRASASTTCPAAGPTGTR
jgi:hypothetical protein